jgi:hypothetical protein
MSAIMSQEEMTIEWNNAVVNGTDDHLRNISKAQAQHLMKLLKEKLIPLYPYGNPKSKVMNYQLSDNDWQAIWDEVFK